MSALIINAIDHNVIRNSINKVVDNKIPVKNLKGLC